jgi:hypothetical protein
MNVLLRLSTAAAVLALAACTAMSYGTKVNPEQVSAIKDGVTTIADVKATLGNPDQDMPSMDGSGAHVAYYKHFESGNVHFTSPFTGKTQMSQSFLEVVYNRDGVVTLHQYQSNSFERRTTGLGGIQDTPVSAKQ